MFNFFKKTEKNITLPANKQLWFVDCVCFQNGENKEEYKGVFLKYVDRLPEIGETVVLYDNLLIKKMIAEPLNDYKENRRLKNGRLPNHQTESRNGVLKQLPKIKDVDFVFASYEDLQIPPNSLIYCDPPYEGTTKYKDDFDHPKFWQWCRDMASKGHIIFVSEYNAPHDFECVWQKEIVSSLTQDTGSKKAVEKLFKFSLTNAQ